MRLRHFNKWVAVLTIPLLASCNTQLVKSGDRIENGKAVVLVGAVGPLTITYLQFCPPTPCVNVRDIVLHEGIVAFPVSVGTSLSLLDVNLKGGRGYYKAGSPTITIDRPGVYYIATLDTLNLEAYSVAPLAEQLRIARNELGGSIGDLRPINFSWPK